MSRNIRQINFSFQDQILKQQPYNSHTTRLSHTTAIQQDSIPTFEDKHTIHNTNTLLAEDQVPDKEHLEPKQKLTNATDTMGPKNTSSFVSKGVLNNAVQEIK